MKPLFMGTNAEIMLWGKFGVIRGMLIWVDEEKETPNKNLILRNIFRAELCFQHVFNPAYLRFREKLDV